ncbi:MAG: 4'-phosphopantetheinyl transferase superfamily protein [Eubacteriales bacterium]|nr:4'-phosphopantetheinyl transferase superfamily protein [Eubacteriales bacterium]
MAMYIYLSDKDYEGSKEKRVRECLLHYCKEEVPEFCDAAITEIPIQKSEKGKPFFPTLPTVHFSVSHSAELWACAFEQYPIGLDIEKKAPAMDKQRSLRIAERFFTREEVSYVSQNGSSAFYRIWVRKEACVKYLGHSLPSGLSCYNMVAQGEIQEEVEGMRFYAIDLSLFGYSGFEAACCFDKQEKPLIKIYSFDSINGVQRKDKNDRAK